MDNAHEILKAIEMSEQLKTCLNYQFLNRISDEVQTEARINIHNLWDEAKTRLQEKYGGTQKPLAKHVWKVIGLDRQREESLMTYSNRLGEELRLLKRRVYEADYQEGEKTIRCLIYEELVIETLKRALPQRLRDAAKNMTAVLDDLLKLIEDDETTKLECQGSPSAPGWSQVKRRRSPVNKPFVKRVEGHQERTRWKPVDGKPKFENSFKSKRTEGNWVPRFPRLCWECGNGGHLARECPFIYRRNRPQNRGEPMEVNAQKTRTDRRRGTGSRNSDTSENSDAEGSILSVISTRSRRWGWNRQRVGKLEEGSNQSHARGGDKAMA